MLSTIEFDDEFLTWRTEIDDVVADGVLTAKMNIGGLVSAQRGP
jgi:hypothetical protein